MSVGGRRGAAPLWVLVLVSALVAGGCGSTVQTSARSASGEVGLDTARSAQQGASAEPGTAGSAETSDGSATQPAGQHGGDAAAASNGVAATGAGGSQATSQGGLPTRGRGWDEKYVYIGIPTLNDLSTFGNAGGYRSVETGNVEGDALAIAADINAKGGLLGRQVRVIFHDTKTASIVTNTDGAVQAACTAFTQDHQVVAVITVFSNFDTDSMRKCLAKTGTALISSSPAGSADDETYASAAPYYHTFATLSFNRFIPTLIRRLNAQRYYTGWDTSLGQAGPAVAVKLGLVFTDNPNERRVAKLVERLFREAGHPIATTVPMGRSPSDTSSAVLTFKSAGVTHVIVMLPAADAVLLNFMAQAESQRYRPRYAISTPQLLSFHADNAPHAQLVGSMGVGWNPGLDVFDQQDPGDVGGGQADCRAALAKGGQTFSGDHRFALALALGLCDGMHMLSEGARAGRAFSATAVRQGLLSIGAGFRAAATFAPTGVAANSYALPGGARDVGWDTGCECFTYRSQTYPLGAG